MSTSFRSTPVRQYDSMERGLRRMFQEFGAVPATVPSADAYETDDEYVIELEVAGYTMSDLAIDVTGQVVTVSGNRKESTDGTDRRYHIHERLERQFERRFDLPDDGDDEHLKAEFEDGVLRLHVPKRPTARRKVEIDKAGAATPGA